MQRSKRSNASDKDTGLLAPGNRIHVPDTERTFLAVLAEGELQGEERNTQQDEADDVRDKEGTCTLHKYHRNNVSKIVVLLPLRTSQR